MRTQYVFHFIYVGSWTVLHSWQPATVALYIFCLTLRLVLCLDTAGMISVDNSGFSFGSVMMHNHGNGKIYLHIGAAD